MTLNARTLAALRRVTGKYLKDTCLIEVQGQAVDEYGSPSLTWTTVASDVSCRVVTAGYQNASRAGLIGTQESMMDLYKLVCPAGTALAPNQRVTVNDVVYQVVQIMTARTDETDTTALLTRQR